MEIQDNRTAHQFELPVTGGVARLEYRRTPHALVLLHTEVPESARGGGVGGRLVDAALQAARAEGLTVTPLCPFARAHMEAHGDATGRPSP